MSEREQTAEMNVSVETAERRTALRKLMEKERTQLNYKAAERTNHAVPTVKRLRAEIVHE